MLFYPDALLEALSTVFTFKVLYWLAIGIVLGVAVGAIPGLTAPTGVALMLPLSFQLETAAALGLLIGLYKGAIFGGSISAISFGTPGTPGAAATVYDGYKLMQKGKGRKAILMALYASVTGDFLSDVITVILAPLIALIALKFGPSERFWLMILAITMLSALSGKHLAKGLLSAAIGFFIGTIGTDPVGAVSRNTFGIWWLQDGVNLVPLMIGIFAMSRMLESSVKILKKPVVVKSTQGVISALFSKAGEGLTFREYISTWKGMLIGLGIGTFVGVLPGLGATVAAFLTYSVVKQMFPEKKLGTGVLEGIAAPEAGNNATVGPTLIPLLAFGIPGSSTAALIGSALMLHGVTPSPRMFTLFPEVIYSLFIILLIGNIFNLGISRLLAPIFARIGQLPQYLLIPLIVMMAIIGSYAYQGNPNDVTVMLVFGLIGLLMRYFSMPDAPLVITFLITSMMEGNFRRALLIAHGNWFHALFNGPISIGLFIGAIVLTYLSVKLHVMERIESSTEAEVKRQKNLETDL